MKLSREDLGDLSNCVMITMMHRESDNRYRWMFEDDESKKVDPILERLLVLQQRLQQEIDRLDGRAPR